MQLTVRFSKLTFNKKKIYEELGRFLSKLNIFFFRKNTIMLFKKKPNQLELQWKVWRNILHPHRILTNMSNISSNVHPHRILTNMSNISSNVMSGTITLSLNMTIALSSHQQIDLLASLLPLPSFQNQHAKNQLPTGRRWWSWSPFLE